MVVIKKIRQEADFFITCRLMIAQHLGKMLDTSRYLGTTPKVEHCVTLGLHHTAHATHTAHTAHAAHAATSSISAIVFWDICNHAFSCQH